MWYGPEWAQAATAPSQLYKAFTHEGGIRVPFILRYPQAHPSLQGGSIFHEFSTVMDLAPTVLDLAGIKHPGTLFQGEEGLSFCTHSHTISGRQVHSMRGKSWSDWLSDPSKPVHDETSVVGWELFGQKAIRKAHWKALFVPEPAGSAEWELYNLITDPGETHNIAEDKPDVLKALIEHWARYEAETGMVLPPPKAFNDHKGCVRLICVVSSKLRYCYADIFPSKHLMNAFHRRTRFKLR